MQYFREKYQNVAFVVASDDRQWITQMFKNMSDVHLTPRYQTMKRGEYDMAILAQCNHSIIRFVIIYYDYLSISQFNINIVLIAKQCRFFWSPTIKQTLGKTLRMGQI